MQALLFKKKTQYILVLVKKNDISELFEDSDVENTKRQRKYALSRILFKKLWHKLFDKQFCEKISPILVLYKTSNECFYSCNGKNIFTRWKMECSIQLGYRLVE